MTKEKEKQIWICAIKYIPYWRWRRWSYAFIADYIMLACVCWVGICRCGRAHTLRITLINSIAVKLYWEIDGAASDTKRLWIEMTHIACCVREACYMNSKSNRMAKRFKIESKQVHRKIDSSRLNYMNCGINGPDHLQKVSTCVAAFFMVKVIPKSGVLVSFDHLSLPKRSKRR